jgi:hypothetical protein
LLLAVLWDWLERSAPRDGKYVEAGPEDGQPLCDKVGELERDAKRLS